MMHVENNLNSNRVLILLINIAAFLFFSTFLVIPDAYSITGLLIFVCCFYAVPQWRASLRDASVRRWVLYFLAVALFWGISFDGWWRWSLEGDLPVKYALATVCVLGTYSLRIHPRALVHALAWGGVLSFGLAIVQFLAQGKATGHTNAIRFGDIAILMGLMCLIFSVVRTFTTTERLFFLLSGCMGIGASLLSLSRGGWPLFLLAPLVCVFGFYKEKLTLKRLLTSICGAVLLGGVSLFAMKDIPALNQRISLATEEARGYFVDRGEYVNTSVGIRLEQWRMSWMLGMEKPITGWGDRGVWDGRRQYVESGKVDASALQVAHTHHEFLEIWARRGLVGVICLALIYMVPFCFFIPRFKEIAEHNKMLYTALHVAGMMVPVGYFVFGLSEVFFFLNIGNIFYIFSMIVIFSSIQWMKQGSAWNAN